MTLKLTQNKNDETVNQCQVLIEKPLEIIKNFIQVVYPRQPFKLCQDLFNTVKFRVIAQQQLHITKIFNGKNESKIKLVDLKSSSDKKKVTDCNSPRETYSIRCFFRRFGAALS